MNSPRVELEVAALTGAAPTLGGPGRVDAGGAHGVLPNSASTV
jgi:hypothetical protein